MSKYIFFGLLFSQISLAGEIDYSYSFNDPTKCDNRCYHDYNFTKLSDNILGRGYAQYNSSDGWVGWEQRNDPVEIDIFFNSFYNINNISFDSLTDRPTELLYYSIYYQEASTWVLAKEDSRLRTSSNSDRYNITNLDFTSDRARLIFTSNRWVLLDEISFTGTVTTISEPKTVWLLAAALLGLFFYRKTKP